MTFKELEDGARFWMGSQIYIKALEDGPHNAVNEKDSSQTVKMPDDFEVQSA